MNFRDIAFKLFWTMVPVLVAFIGTAITDWNPGFGVAVAAVVQIVTSYARQRLGETPPTLA